MPYRVPPWQWQVKAARNWTKQDASTLAAATTRAIRQRVTRDHVLGVGEDTTVRAAYPAAASALVDSYFDSLTDAAAEGVRLATVYGMNRGLYEIETGMLGVTLRRGESITVTYPARDFAAGKNLRIVGVQVSSNRGCRIVAFG